MAQHWLGACFDTTQLARERPSGWTEHHADDDCADAGVLKFRDSFLEDQRGEGERHDRIGARQRNYDRDRAVAARDHHAQIATGHHAHRYKGVQILAYRVRSLPALE